MATNTQHPVAPDAQQTALIETLKQALKLRGFTYARLATSLDLSEVTVKRMFSRGTFSLQRLVQICACLDMDLFELTRLARMGAGRVRQLSLEQEHALARNEPLMLLFHLLLAGWRLVEIRNAYDFEAARLEPLLMQLQQLGLVRRTGKDTVQLKVARNLAWRPQGPVMRRYGKAAMQEFLGAPFESDDELLHLQTRELSASSLAILKRKLDRLGREFMELAELDSAAPSDEEKRNVGMVLALRPWVFSIARARKRSV